MAIKGKYVNEVEGGDKVSDDVNTEYLSQIIQVIE